MIELFNGEKSTGELCKALGYVKEGIPQYKVIEKDLKTLYSQGFLSRRKGKTGGRPGTFWKIKEDLNTLRRLIVKYRPNREIIEQLAKSEYYNKMIPKIIKRFEKRAKEGGAPPITKYDIKYLEQALKGSLGVLSVCLFANPDKHFCNTMSFIGGIPLPGAKENYSHSTYWISVFEAIANAEDLVRYVYEPLESWQQPAN